MISNAILVIIGIVILVFIALMWLRFNLMQDLREVRQQEMLLREDLHRRRDMIPYMLEMFRRNAEPNQAWRDLLTARSSFHVPGDTDWEAEWSFEKQLLHFIDETDFKDVDYLESEKQITKLTETIQKEHNNWENAVDRFEKRSSEFPYSLAAKVFGMS